MGHPHQAPELEVLCELETQRHEEHMLAIAEHIKSLKAGYLAVFKSAYEIASRFIMLFLPLSLCSLPLVWLQVGIPLGNRQSI